jgi:hypothetical protein
MAKADNQFELDPEIAAINSVVKALKDLDATIQYNVIDYVVRRFKIRLHSKENEFTNPPSSTELDQNNKNEREFTNDRQNDSDSDGLDGVSPIARKWMSRSGFNSAELSKLFSLGIEEIDLVAKKVPGKNKKDRMRSVILLKSVAAYLGSGVARVSHDQCRETCLHYDAYDGSNFATYIKEMSAEVGGTKESGYTLTARGLTSATELVKEILNPSSK